ncbi:MAG: TIGR04255 family protein [Methanocorpusculum sp.]|uniref:TIGR04255 family protein n=1 Tax=Methanocorpusculum sp. TaxID=2058474 RepID=UPI002725763B|nr:TIGR04255 family protein [Methanocorpusculum sp.]MDO9523477.1 TIGR04255 family protein [Methanocorpusculum sp.]
MSNYNGIKYKNNFIKKVICRVDFVETLSNESISDQKLDLSIKESYQYKKMDQRVRVNLIDIMNDNPGEELAIKNHSQEGLQKTYLDEDGNKLILSNTFFVVECTHYGTFESYVASFKAFLNELFLKNNINTMRIGLRYVNILDANTIKIQKNFFVSPISGAAQRNAFEKSDLVKLVRSIQTTEYVYGDLRLNFRYGFINENYPAPISKNDFVLDFDCFSPESMNTADDIITTLTNCHKIIQELFETSITDKLRLEMNNGKTK